jgi:hypothetical protein
MQQHLVAYSFPLSAPLPRENRGLPGLSSKLAEDVSSFTRSTSLSSDRVSQCLRQLFAVVVVIGTVVIEPVGLNPEHSPVSVLQIL